MVDDGTTRFRVAQDGSSILIEACGHWMNHTGDNVRQRPAERVELVHATTLDSASGWAAKALLYGAEGFLYPLIADFILGREGSRSGMRQEAVFPDHGFAARRDVERRHLEIVRLENRNPVTMVSNELIIRNRGERVHVERAMLEVSTWLGWTDPALNMA